MKILVWLTLAFVPLANTTTLYAAAPDPAPKIDLRVSGKHTLVGAGPRFPMPQPPVEDPYRVSEPKPTEPKKVTK